MKLHQAIILSSTLLGSVFMFSTTLKVYEMYDKNKKNNLISFYDVLNGITFIGSISVLVYLGKNYCLIKN